MPDDLSSKPVVKFVFDPRPTLPSFFRINLSHLELARQLVTEKLAYLHQLGPTGTAQDEYEHRLKELDAKLNPALFYLSMFGYEDAEIRPWRQ